MRHINIITADNNSGLSRDATIVTTILKQANFNVTFFDINSLTRDHRGQPLNSGLPKTPIYDINLFLEHVVPPLFPCAKLNCLITNQEWFWQEWLPDLPHFDYILCKTRFAQRIFNKLGCRTEFISFTSFDRLDETQTKRYDKFFHLAGKSPQKGTNAILGIWQRNPGLPDLTIRRNWQELDRIGAANIEYITEHLDDIVLRNYQNSHGIHLCPSEAEGFGHGIVEAMSCRSVILTTNAPPMNELITPDRGILVDCNKAQVQGVGINYYVDRQALEQTIHQVLGTDDGTKKEWGDNARAWYEDNDVFFRHRIVDVINNI
ncbi:glycosyl transferase, group 1 family protein [Coleofasciculus chthonoplastes PCC 7420]|uniref:Glycosyl transferase, group 1 family protein n=1 Tax=Coleofasciculus chthonoplastes PCC 7420 TaxID=118168 RepID=B4VM26_9CYAN|nr:glycosyltransferase [Coleofasciculus chthonoplastes]EDX76778.1 glycosyl transferase, group 1 family protein [Coleofasciculus chthonoplastes PCC 7420]